MNCPNCERELVQGVSVCVYCGQDLAAQTRRRRRVVLIPLVAIIIVLAGFLVWRTFTLVETLARIDPVETANSSLVSTEAPAPPVNPASGQLTSLSLADQVRPQAGYPLPASFGQLGPRLVEAGGIDYDRFAQLYFSNGQPLTDHQIAVLKEGSEGQVVIDADNAYFLLNFFWAVGLTNQNRILEEGQMMERGADQVGYFASTGGWTLGTKPSTELYSSAPLISLTAEQQALVEDVAGAVYRPCCGNPTSFPDCNHGMALLGLLELMASQGATLDEMFVAVKYVNAFWFPQQTLEVALYFQATEGVSFVEMDPRRAFGVEFFSGQGYARLHKWLADNNLLQQMPNQGGSCGV